MLLGLWMTTSGTSFFNRGGLRRKERIDDRKDHVSEYCIRRVAVVKNINGLNGKSKCVQAQNASKRKAAYKCSLHNNRTNSNLESWQIFVRGYHMNTRLV